MPAPGQRGCLSGLDRYPADRGAAGCPLAPAAVTRWEVKRVRDVPRPSAGLPPELDPRGGGPARKQAAHGAALATAGRPARGAQLGHWLKAVSYTHLTLTT